MKLNRDEIDILIAYHEETIEYCKNRIDELDANESIDEAYANRRIDELIDSIEDHESRIEYLKEIDRNTDWRNVDYAN